MLSMLHNFSALTVICVLDFAGGSPVATIAPTSETDPGSVPSAAYAAELVSLNDLEIELAETKRKIADLDRMTHGAVHLEAESALLAIDHASLALALVQMDPNDDNIRALVAAMTDMKKATEALLSNLP